MVDLQHANRPNRYFANVCVKEIAKHYGRGISQGGTISKENAIYFILFFITIFVNMELATNIEV